MAEKQNKFSFKERLASFKYAFEGLRFLLLFEHNSRIHLIAAIVAITLSFVLKISGIEWLIILIVIGLVFVTELLNSAIEDLAGKVTSEYDEKIKRIKDYGAAAVLISCLVALVAGVLIFIPKILLLLK